jgi:hypothetical protein
MNWVVLLSVLVGWLLLGLAVANLFGRFIREAEGPDNADDLGSSVVSYLRRVSESRPPLALACQPRLSPIRHSPRRDAQPRPDTSPGRKTVSGSGTVIPKSARLRWSHKILAG